MRQLKGSFGTKKLKFLIGTTAVIVTGIWYWIWQAPYRTLTVFVDALYVGDTQKIYELMPAHEKGKASVGIELVERTYHQFLKPLLEQKYSREKIIHIQREKTAFTRPREALFYIWFQGEKHPLVIYLCLPSDRQGWRVPFSYFVWLTAKGIYGDPNPVMRQLGYKKVATTDGGFFWLQ